MFDPRGELHFHFKIEKNPQQTTSARDFFNF